MAKAYLIMKQMQRAWGINVTWPHEVHATRKEANAECKKLNDRARNLHYFVESVSKGKESK